MIWRRLADWCVPAKALRWGKHPPMSLAMLDAIIRNAYIPALRDQLQGGYNWWFPPYVPNRWSFYDRTGLSADDDGGDDW
jgi:hypothetical protein